jgi:hypothetical protein
MGDSMNYPTSDIQFLAQLVRKQVRDPDAPLTVDEDHRLKQLAEKGYSDSTPTSGGGT